MFGNRTKREVERARERIEKIEERLSEVEFPARDPIYARYGVIQSRYCASTREVGDLRHELRLLAAALGYEWVPEGKTPARWEKKGEPIVASSGDFYMTKNAVYQRIGKKGGNKK